MPVCMTTLYQVTVTITQRRTPETLGGTLEFDADLAITTKTLVFRNQGCARQALAHNEATAETRRQAPGVEVEVSLSEVEFE